MKVWGYYIIVLLVCFASLLFTDQLKFKEILCECYRIIVMLVGGWGT